MNAVGDLEAQPAEEAVAIVLGVEADAAAGIVDPPVAALGQRRARRSPVGDGKVSAPILILEHLPAGAEIDAAQPVGDAAGRAVMRPPGVEFAAPTWSRVVMNCGVGAGEDPGGILDPDEAGLVPGAIVGVEDAVVVRDLAARPGNGRGRPRRTKPPAALNE